jgi:hypothetical protein
MLLTLEKSSSHPENRMIRELARLVVTHSTQRIPEGMNEATKQIRMDASPVMMLSSRIETTMPLVAR